MFLFTARRYASVVYGMDLCLSVCLSVCLSQVLEALPRLILHCVERELSYL